MHSQSPPHLGHTLEQIAEMHAVSKPTLYGWYDRLCSGGVEGLAKIPSSTFLNTYNGLLIDESNKVLTMD